MRRSHDRSKHVMLADRTLRTAPVSHQKRSGRSITNAIEIEQKLSKINKPDRHPPAHNGLVAGSSPAGPTSQINCLVRDYFVYGDWLADVSVCRTADAGSPRASWPNQVETWFSILQGPSLNGASFPAVAQLQEHIDAFMKKHSPSPGQKNEPVKSGSKARRIAQL
jgi:hypothetical protein